MLDHLAFDDRRAPHFAAVYSVTVDVAAYACAMARMTEALMGTAPAPSIDTKPAVAGLLAETPCGPIPRDRLVRRGVIRIGDVQIEYTPWGCVTHYADGASYGAHPHPDLPHYREITERCGYGTDTLAYAREHEVCHQIVGQWLCHTGSYVMTALAHGEEPFASDALLEEIATMTLQRWLRAGERPIVGGVDWDDVKARALVLLDSASG